jgi:hypothetical protein
MSARIAISWLIVLIPILYGLIETIRKAATLFTG